MAVIEQVVHLGTKVQPWMQGVRCALCGYFRVYTVQQPLNREGDEVRCPYCEATARCGG